MKTGLAAVVVSGVVALGCDPAFRVHGTVVEEGTGAAIEGVAVTVTCGSVNLAGTSDVTGKFSVKASTGIVPKDLCDVVIVKAGYTTRRPTIEGCSSQWTDCNRDLGQIELAPGP